MKRRSLAIVYTTWKSPLGKLLIAAEPKGIVYLSFQNSVTWLKNEFSATECIAVENVKSEAAAKKAASHVKQCETALKSYFKGNHTALQKLTVSPAGTDFQKQVWKAMRKIKAGAPLSYGELAKKIGRPTAARAVGAACRTNPIVLVVPCHRVIGSNQCLTGFAAGLNRKANLLKHEGYSEFRT